MIFFEILLVLLLFTAIASTIAAKIKMPIEIFLLLASLLISLLPKLPTINLKPDTLLVLFLPPIIFSAAFFTSWRDFVANKRPISLLAIGLVLFTMCVVAVTLKLLIADMSWPICFLFGAIISPTDASSAVSLVKKLKIPRRLITIIEGESLVNDATALIAYRYALITLTTGTLPFWDAGLHFFIAAIGGIILGLLIGYISIKLFSWISEAKAQGMFTLVIPYFSYITAERLTVSAIICLVTAGIYFSRKFPVIASAESRSKITAIWELFIFAMNALIFILIGLQLPAVFEGLGDFSIAQLILYGLMVNFVIITIRFIWVYPAAYIPRFLSAALRKKDPYPHWTELATLSWIGMRGILSLTLVMSLPHFLPSGEIFPYRSLLILLTYSVILITILLPTFTLPKLIQLFKFRRDDQQYREEALARIESIKAVLKELENICQSSTDITDYVNHLRGRYQRRLNVLESNLKELPYSTLNTIDQKIRQLTKNLINIERTLLIDLRRNGTIHDEVFHRLERELDLEDLRLKTQRI